MAHAWNACWVHALGGSNPPSSALVMCRDIVHTMSRHFLCLGALMCRVIVPLFLVMCQDIVPFCTLRKGYHETLLLPCGHGSLRSYCVSLLLLLIAVGCSKSQRSLRHDVS